METLSFLLDIRVEPGLMGETGLQTEVWESRPIGEAG